MKESTPSRTAAWVALARGMASHLPPDARLAEDPYGAEFEDDGARRRLHALLERARVPVHRFPAVMRWILYMQVRTRVIDDAVRAFVAAGGRQLVLLGAGYDTRALRLPELAGVHVLEVDHPATQSHKQAVLARLGATSPSTYVTWDFEARAMDELPGALAEAGLDRTAPAFTIWEGVTMYLTERAIDASLRAIRAWSPPGSRLAMTYFARSRLERPSLATRAIRAVVSRVGEPWRFGWEPQELPAYLAARGFRLERDVSFGDAARELLPASFAAMLQGQDRRISFASAHESIALGASIS
ncbi:MAG: class I SAM-dependent methyltransferase [Acidobacteriota bacterium]